MIDRGVVGLWKWSVREVSLYMCMYILVYIWIEYIHIYMDRVYPYIWIYISIYMDIYIYICVYLKSSSYIHTLFQNAISTIPKIDVAMSLPSSEVMFKKRASHNMYTYVFICEKIFSKTQSMNLPLALQAQFLKWRLSHFGRGLFIYRCLIYLHQTAGFPCRRL